MNLTLKDRNDHINPNQIKFDLEGKIYNSGKVRDTLRFLYRISMLLILTAYT